MIFNVEDHIEQIIACTKTQTRRASDRYQVGRLYAVQPCRTCRGIKEGRIFIAMKVREWKPDHSDLPQAARFARRWRGVEAGYHIQDYDARAEGGYTPEEYEALYEGLHPEWTERWAYYFTFSAVDDPTECGAKEPGEARHG
jgi:hypothetical protein